MIVIPALGRPGRSDEIPPEWLRPAERGSSLLDGFLSALSGTVQAAGLLIIHLDRPGVAEFLRARLAGSGLDAELVALSRPTRGEAETVRLGLGAIGAPVEAPLTVLGAEALRDPAQLPPSPEADGWLECAEGAQPLRGFVQGDAMGRLEGLAEQRGLSRLCCTGLYRLRSVALFRGVLNRLERRGGQELSMAALFRQMLAEGRDLRYALADAGASAPSIMPSSLAPRGSGWTVALAR
ncbi:hypothetical protein MVG78_19195 [Roseomonas gilardii subsp. gilardii]|uniref:hypothetical protein n=1 Tax=Roseomonas gilardii TaxID=257708 RepID=UPI001FF9D3D6|nr:hypothetical protein [Roseomonas gilardii]UPG72569.1 hypothetical protein MVG78_19195 [Roseomonas gilardii subsp. gilardii]